jgi:hypothetical protein
VGLCLVLLDVPYDTFGPGAGWWQWSASDPNMKTRWLGVPVTSYEWYLVFGAMYAGLLRALKPKLARWTTAPGYILLPPLVGAGVIVLGVAGFIPFHLLKAAGAPEGAIVAAHLAAVGVIAWKTRGPTAMRASVLILQLYPALLIVLLPPSQWAAKAAAAAAAIAGMAVIGSSRARTSTASAYPDVDSTSASSAGSPRRSGT